MRANIFTKSDYFRHLCTISGIFRIKEKSGKDNNVEMKKLMRREINLFMPNKNTIYVNVSANKK